MVLTAYASRSDLDSSYLQSTYYALFDFESTVVTTLAGNPIAGLSNGIGASASFSKPEGICIDKAGNLYVADTGNNVIRQISASGQVTTFAGTGVAGSQLGNTTNSQFSGPTSVTIDNTGNLYVADANNVRVCQISPNGTVAIFYHPSHLGRPALWQIEADPFGNIDVGYTLEVVQISPGKSSITLAGAPSTFRNGCADGWCAGVGVGVDSAANVYATTAALIYKIPLNGTNEMYAGQPLINGNSQPGYSDGSRLLSWFESPQDAAVDESTNVFVSDTTRVRKISNNGWVSTMGGSGVYGYQNGRGSVAQFDGAAGLCVDTNGNIFVADSTNNCIREISPDTAGIGIPDWWQKKYFGYVGIDPNSSPNNTGMTTYEDFWAGLNPTNPASVFKIEHATVSNNGTQVSWDSVLGKNYTVQSSSDLKLWNTIGGSISGTGSIISYTDSSAAAQNAQRFYRIVVSF